MKSNNWVNELALCDFYVIFLPGITTKEISFYLTIKPSNNQDRSAPWSEVCKSLTEIDAECEISEISENNELLLIIRPNQSYVPGTIEDQGEGIVFKLEIRMQLLNLCVGGLATICNNAALSYGKLLHCTWTTHDHIILSCKTGAQNVVQRLLGLV
ncbi:hypothetical protein NC651_029710 [Populus alba x Populus x berolinensis]|nr:hypothetical protein NC651_029710 [Populus alba x Populus x berolinensis]